MTIVEFLRARIDEDERMARDGDDLWGPVYVEGYGDYALMGGGRLRAECRAKRAIIELATAAPRSIELAVDVLLELAAVYADHFDYQPEWAPEV